MISAHPEPNPRVAVVGAGAMGSVYGAAMAAHGLDVTLVDVSAPLLEAIARDGVRVTSGGEERVVRLPATDQPAAIGPVDVVFFYVKGYHTPGAMALAAPLVDPGTAVVTLQNGWGNGDVLAARFGPERVVVGVSYHSATALGPGRVARTTPDDVPTYVGPFVPAARAAAQRVAAVLAAGGFHPTLTDDVASEIWKKVTLNAAALPTAALTGYPAAPMADDATLLALVDALAAETVAVGQAAGLNVDLGERIAAIHQTLRRAGLGKASMLQDVEADRRTEIETINGAVVRLGEQHGIDVPLNLAMLALVRGRERARGLG